MEHVDIYSLKQAHEILEMVEGIKDRGRLLELVQQRVKVIEARGALREANEARLQLTCR